MSKLLSETTDCPTCEGTGKVPIMFGTCPVTPSMGQQLATKLESLTFFSTKEMEVLNDMLDITRNHWRSYGQPLFDRPSEMGAYGKPKEMTEEQWKAFQEKLS